MLTRSEVAKQIGKSVATVRRLEGRVLFPLRDCFGVHRFDPDAVETLRRELALKALGIPSGPEVSAEGTSELRRIRKLEERVAALEALLEGVGE